ncbi:MAG: biotin/lipoate A/B protein ligase family protein [Thermoplasmata archaeon]
MENPPLPLTSSVDPGRKFTEFRDLHEGMLRAGAPRVNVGVVRDLAVSYGVAEAEGAPYLVRARADGVTTVRRSSGGSGIVHAPGDLVWAVVLPRSDPRVGRDFVRAYDRFGRGLVSFLADRGLEGRWVHAPGLSTEYCPLSERGFVLEVDGKVLAAAAQHLTGSALLHHGTLARAVDRARIARWFSFATPNAVDRLATLTDLGIGDPPESVARELAAHLSRGLAP